MAFTCRSCGAVSSGQRCVRCRDLLPFEGETVANADVMSRLLEARSAFGAGDRERLVPLLAEAALLRFSLLVAADLSPAELVSWLLEQGAMSDVEAPAETSVVPGAQFRRTPMAAAIQRQDAEIVRILVEAGALARKKEAELALHRAARRNSAEVLRSVLVPYVGIDVGDAAGDSSLVNACREEAPAAVAALIAAGANVNTRGGYDGRTPLMAAAAKGNLEIVSLLLAAGADPNATDIAGDTAVATARRRGHAHVEEALLEASRRV